MSEYPVVRSESRAETEGVRVRHGGCSCGRVRFTVRGEPLTVGLCHCLECRKATGAPYVAYADWPRGAFTVAGHAREYQGRSFCTLCGSRLFHLTGDQAEVMLGALDEAPGDLWPLREGWTGRREHWLAPVEGAGQFDEDPPADHR
ncbi:MAG: GFA family protein [Alphaproteobacteria bacterium]